MVFRYFPATFAEKESHMCTLKKSYLRLWRFIEKVDASEMEIRSFEDVCRRIGASPSSLDELLFNELGLSGQETIDNAFKNY